MAANKVVRRMIQRYRWRKVIEQSKVMAEFKARCQAGSADLLNDGEDNSAKIPPKPRYEKRYRKHKAGQPGTDGHSSKEHPGRSQSRGSSPTRSPTPPFTNSQLRNLSSDKGAMLRDLAA